MNQPLWKAEDVVWDVLSKSYQIGDFYIASLDGEPSGCMAIVDYDPFFWPDVSKGESVMIHKLAVKHNVRKVGISDMLMNYAKGLAKQRDALTVRLDCHQFRPKLRAFYERHGFICVGEKTYLDIYNVPKYNTAFYIYTLPDVMLAQNKLAWNAIADDWFGATALPTYGCLCPSEDELHLFPDLKGMRVLDIGCGSGHSLKWCGDHGASELWGLDMSDRQIENAERYLRESGYAPKLFCSPMEQNPSLPNGYFDVV